MAFIPIFNFLASILILFLAFLLMSSIIFKKVKKVKTDIFIIEKCISTLILFTFEIITLIYMLLEDEPNEGGKFLTKVAMHIFNIYIVFFFLIKLLSSREFYLSFYNPHLVILAYIKNQKSNILYEISMIVFNFILYSISIFIFPGIIKQVTNDNKFSETPFIFFDLWKWAILLVMSIIICIYYVITYKNLSNFMFKTKIKLIKVLKKNIIMSVIYMVSCLFYGSCLIVMLCSGSSDYSPINVISSFMLLFLIFSDFITDIYEISISKYTRYILRSTLMYKIGRYFNSEIDPLLGTNAMNATESTFKSTMLGESGTYDESQIFNSVSGTDVDIVKCFKSGYFFEDYFLDYYDKFLNITLSSIYKIYTSQFFNAKVEMKKIGDEMDINVSNIGINSTSMFGINDNSVTKNISSTNSTNPSSKLSEGTQEFFFTKNENKNDFNQFANVLYLGGSNHCPVDVKVSSYFTPECNKIVYDKNINCKQLGGSLLSHFILTNQKRNPDNPIALYYSLVSSNLKEEYFGQSINLTLKTFDKKLNIDIFEGNDDEIALGKNNSNEKFAELLTRYFNYMNGEGSTGSFIPNLVGIFKVQINKFRPIFYLITKNLLVENAPKNFFTYWQLIRFTKDQQAKIASSKYSTKSLIKDDPIFNREFTIETKNDNPNFNKISLKNYYEFKDIIERDIKFLKSCKNGHFSFLMMYFEYENTQKHEKDGVIVIKKGVDDKAEIINKSIDDNQMNSNNINNNTTNTDNKPMNSMIDESAMSGTFNDSLFSPMNELDGIIGVGQANNGGAVNLMDYSEKINLSAYEGVFDNFNCLCLYSFENVFDVSTKINLTTNYHDYYKKKILENFICFEK